MPVKPWALMHSIWPPAPNEEQVGLPHATSLPSRTRRVLGNVARATDPSALGTDETQEEKHKTGSHTKHTGGKKGLAWEAPIDAEQDG